MYKLLKDENGQDRTDMILKDGNMFIPADEQNSDWIAYQAWLDDGNEPEAAE